MTFLESAFHLKTPGKKNNFYPPNWFAVDCLQFFATQISPTTLAKTFDMKVHELLLESPKYGWYCFTQIGRKKEEETTKTRKPPTYCTPYTYSA